MIRTIAVCLAAFLVTPTLAAPSNGRFTFSIDGPCGEIVVGPPGSEHDDGTGGIPYYNEWREFQDGVTRLIARQRPGHTWNVSFTSSDVEDWRFGVQAWSYAIGAVGPLGIVDVTQTTAACTNASPALTFPECLRSGGGTDLTSLVVASEEDQIDENAAAYSLVVSGTGSSEIEGRVEIARSIE